jgi:hypothetical protein
VFGAALNAGRYGVASVGVLVHVLEQYQFGTYRKGLERGKLGMAGDAHSPDTRQPT